MSPPRRSWAYGFLLTALFVASQVYYYLRGVRFDITPLGWYWQYLDVDLLRHDLARSLWYLHSQPPLFNLFLGLVLQGSGGAAAAVFHAIYVATGYVFATALYCLQRRLGVGRVWALAATAAYLFSPAFILYEHWLFYAFPAATLGVGAALVLHVALTSGRVRAYAAFFLLLLALCGTWHIFHLAFFAVAAAAAVRLARREVRWKVAAAALVPCALLAGWYGKNLALFGEFGASSWRGMVLWSMAARGLSYGESLRLAQGEGLSSAAFVPTFSPLASYPRAYSAVPPRFRDVAALSRPTKSTGPANFNHYGYLALSRSYQRDFNYVIRRYPRSYFRTLWRSWRTYFQSTADYEAGVAFLDEAGNLSRVGRETRLYDCLFFGKVRWADAAGEVAIGGDERLTPRATYLTLIAGLILAAVSGGVTVLGRRGADDASARADRAVCGFMLFTVIYLALVANATAWVETNRMRFQTDPYSVTLLVLGIQLVLRRRDARSRPASLSYTNRRAGRS